MRIRQIAFSAAFAAGLAALPLSTAEAQYYPPCWFPLAFPFCVAGAVVGTAATIVTAPIRALTPPPYYGPAPAYYAPPPYAYAPPAYAPRPAVFMRACFQERQQLCGAVPPGGGRILQCLRAQAPQLSAPCSAAIGATYQAGQPPTVR